MIYELRMGLSNGMYIAVAEGGRLYVLQIVGGTFECVAQVCHTTDLVSGVAVEEVDGKVYFLSLTQEDGETVLL